MKKFSSVVSLSFLLIFLFVSNVYSFGWVKYKTDNDENVYFYKKGSIKHLTKDIVQVSVKTVFSDEGKKYELKFLEENGLPDIEKYNSLSYEISLEKIDCKNNKSQFLSLTSYDADDKILFPYSYKEQKWEDINPDSLLDILQKKSVNNAAPQRPIHRAFSTITPIESIFETKVAVLDLLIVRGFNQ